MPLGETNKGGHAKRDQTKRSEVRLGAAINTMADITPLFDGLFMLTIKDNANNICEAHLDYLVRYCANFCKSEVIKQEYEFGKQGRFHVHAVCKSKSGKLPNIKGLDSYLKKYKIWFEREDSTRGGHILTRTLIDINSLTFHISAISDENHSKAVDKYIKKEQGEEYFADVDFIDD